MNIKHNFNWWKYLAIGMVIVVILLTTVMTWHIREEGRSHRRMVEYSTMMKMAEEISQYGDKSTINDILEKYNYRCKYPWDNVVIYRRDIPGQDSKYLMIIYLGNSNSRLEHKQ